jgi:PKD repeat protein
MIGTADNTIKVEPVKKAHIKKAPEAMEYRATFGTLNTPKTVRRADAKGLVADFSVQGESAYKVVWSENFDSNETLTQSGWTLDYGEGNAVTIEKKKSDDYNTIDENDVYSLYFDGPYQIFKRTKASATSPAVTVPANSQLHVYIRTIPNFNDYATLSVQISTDDFATFEEVWNSQSIAQGKAQWVTVEADLSAYAGKQIKIRFFWGPAPGDTLGGYMSTFYVDGISITGVNSVEQVTAKTGDEIKFVDLSTGGNITSWAWSFPGGTPESSSEQNPTVYYTESGTYDVILRVSDGTNNAEVAKKAFVSVEGQLPVAGIQFPADFRTTIQPRMRMIAPLAPVTYKDASEGFPTDYIWTIYSQYELNSNTSFMFTPDTVYTTKDVTVCHNKQYKNYVTHIVKNPEGYTYADDSVQVQFAGFVSNFQKNDGYQTNFVDGDLTMPGANKMGITAWAERISKPSVPVVLEAMYVGFTKASATALADQISPVSFSLYTSENGLPGKPIELLDSWNLSELNYAMGANSGMVTIELGRRVIIDQEVFLVIDGIPEKNDSLECAIGMAPLRSYGNTAYMLNKGTWRPFTGYFQAAPGGQTSLAVYPYFTHSVLIPAKVDKKGGITMGNDTTLVGPTSGNANILVFANQGIFKYLGSNADWCRVTGKPGEYTVDSVKVEFDALPEGTEWRDAGISVTDSVQTLNLVVRQSRSAHTGIQSVVAGNASAITECFDIQGRRIGNGLQPRGIYLERRGNQVRKVLSR